MSAKGNNTGTNPPDLKLLAELNAILGLSAIKVALTHQPHTMPPLGQLAYEAYCESRNWLSLSGDHLPQWHDQAQNLKSAWEASAQAVQSHLAHLSQSQIRSLSPSGATTPARPHSGTP